MKDYYIEKVLVENPNEIIAIAECNANELKQVTRGYSKAGENRMCITYTRKKCKYAYLVYKNRLDCTPEYLDLKF